MRLFKCQACGQTVFFENHACEQCGHVLGFNPGTMQLLAVEETPKGVIPVSARNRHFRHCANHAFGACNWLIPRRSREKFCAACRHNHAISSQAEGENLPRWRKMEGAKHRLFYTLIALGLPLASLKEHPDGGLAFDFLTDPPTGPRILTGHDNGLITINLVEADDAAREKFRTDMHEPYRTLIGHFRHEVGHYFWNVLVRDGGRLDECRAMFGDDTIDYGEALKAHYESGPPEGWQESYISAYATTHPWEDFAETWAHYLHIVDTLETASAFGLRIHPVSTTSAVLHADINFSPYRAHEMQTLIDAWVPLTFAMNSLARSMGQSDLYPFVLSPRIMEKLSFIHDLVHDAANRAAPAPAPGRHARQPVTAQSFPVGVYEE